MFVVGAFVLFGNFAHATEIQYNLLAPLPGGSNQVSGDQAFSTYARQAFAVALSAAAILALLMLVVGGIQYLGSAESPSRLSDAKDRIWNALIGLVLAVAAWLILNTINPALVSGDFNLPSVNGSTSRQCFCTCNDGSAGTIVTRPEMCTSSCSARGGVKSCSTS
jgi:hypothetical protein